MLMLSKLLSKSFEYPEDIVAIIRERFINAPDKNPCQLHYFSLFR